MSAVTSQSEPGIEQNIAQSSPIPFFRLGCGLATLRAMDLIRSRSCIDYDKEELQKRAQKKALAI
jgi:hypothetical protein